VSWDVGYEKTNISIYPGISYLPYGFRQNGRQLLYIYTSMNAEQSKENNKVWNTEDLGAQAG
jgi:hypothetical protein